ncbi:RNA-guided endonuclease TnpB family protein [Exiguobacterium sp. s142]|uniref:RNA-guided endonuclease TnpB family protein n=1 Tax=Exiguobacterium sp. s142 TaxID=2751222 RepID=UPI001BE7F8B9|nr:RNA-guided endonuclease TnpB family protein [Exiguobacterium sp. s142]
MLKGYKYRLYPTAAQADFLVRTIGCARFVYNKLLEDSLALANAKLHLDAAFAKFFAGTAGFPVFKSKRKARASYTTNDALVTEKIPNPRNLREAEARLKRAQRALSRKKPGSRNREKARLLLAKKHEQVKNRRHDFLHKLSRRIVDENQVVVVETLKPREMMQDRRLSKSIGDAGWGEFVRQLEYKARFYGRTLIQADPWFASTQVCSACGENGGRKELDVREWTCAACGALHDRDVNASLNLLRLAD